MEIIVSSFYKYITIKQPKKFQIEHHKYCNNLGIKGKILVSKEGINGTISGTKEQIDKYEKDLVKNKLFSDIAFKRTTAQLHPFKKTVVRVRKEIVTSGMKVDMNKRGTHLLPEKLKEMYNKKEEFVIVDARNNYEYKIGKFKEAITPKIETFREFKKVPKQLKEYKDKKIVMYCTGGVRCEKASAYMIKKGFKKVYQLEGGILNYIQKFPDSYFEGRCFVFDDRLSITSGKKTKDISVCEKCHKPSGRYINCLNKYCDRLFICCEECDGQWNGCCSKTCIGKIEVLGEKCLK